MNFNSNYGSNLRISDLDGLVKKKTNIPYLIDQHLLEKDSA